jgi:hypothetical protein
MLFLSEHLTKQHLSSRWRLGIRQAIRLCLFVFFAGSLCVFLAGVYFQIQSVVHGRHVMCFGVWPEVPASNGLFHQRTQQVVDRTLALGDTRVIADGDQLSLYRVSARFRFKSSEECLAVAHITPEHILYHFGGSFLPVVRYHSPHSLSWGGLVVRRDEYVLSFSANYFWQSVIKVTVFKVPTYLMLFFGGVPISFWFARFIARRSNKRRASTYGFLVVPSDSNKMTVRD